MKNERAATEALSVAYRLAELRHAVRPFRLHWFPTLRSTSDHAAELRRRGGLFAPALVLTGRQTAGRGRGGHAWWAGKGCVTATFALPQDANIQPHQLPLLTGLAVRNAAAELSGADIQLKWPNDIWFERRKLGGLLCERMLGLDLVGIGFNVNLDMATVPATLRPQVATLAEAAKTPLDLTAVLAAVAQHLYSLWRRQRDRPFAALLREYDAHHALVGRRISVITPDGEPAITGRCEGLDHIGRLLLRCRGRVHHVLSGHVQVIL